MGDSIALGTFVCQQVREYCAQHNSTSHHGSQSMLDSSDVNVNDSKKRRGKSEQDDYNSAEHLISTVDDKAALNLLGLHTCSFENSLGVCAILKVDGYAKALHEIASKKIANESQIYKAVEGYFAQIIDLVIAAKGDVIEYRYPNLV